MFEWVVETLFDVDFETFGCSVGVAVIQVITLHKSRSVIGRA